MRFAGTLVLVAFFVSLACGLKSRYPKAWRLFIIVSAVIDIATGFEILTGCTGIAG